MSHASSRRTSLGITQNLWYDLGYLILFYYAFAVLSDISHKKILVDFIFLL
jgi:hypothetical protein